jgi:hypothetical protein|tara:strand:+ start:16491 stop:16772 length:282 start_codon:yes stop_codon:yes gene_type:complete
MTDTELKALTKKIECDLLKLFGTPILTVSDLKKAMNYSSTAAIHQAVSKGTFPIPVFKMPNRRGHFALTVEVARFMALQATDNIQKVEGKDMN